MTEGKLDRRHPAPRSLRGGRRTGERSGPTGRRNEAPREVGSLGLIAFLRATYRRSLKSARSDEWINTYAIRPAASVLVWVFYRLRLRPVQVVLLGGVAGTLAGVLLLALPGGRGARLGGLCLMAKVVLDAADGQLARATGRVDRVGRFSDSIVDFWVNGVVTLSAGAAAAGALGGLLAISLGAAAFLLILLQCSLFVFYQVTYLSRSGRAEVNRTDESLRDGDETPLVLRLQRVYLLLYGWQDRIMARLDAAFLGRARRRWSRADGSGRERPADARDALLAADRLEGLWYADPLGLRLSSFLGLGTSLSGFSALLLAGSPAAGLLWIVAGESLMAAAVLLYRMRWKPPA